MTRDEMIERARQEFEKEDGDPEAFLIEMVDEQLSSEDGMLWRKRELT